MRHWVGRSWASLPSGCLKNGARWASAPRSPQRAALFDGSYGNHNTLSLDGIVSEVRGPLRLGLEGNSFNTDGYPIVKKSVRGSIDVNATSQPSTFNGRLDLVMSPDLSFYLRGNHYDEDRGNGTPLQNNDTEAGSFATGGRLRTGDGSDWSFSLYGDFQKFTSTFSTQVAVSAYEPRIAAEPMMRSPRTS